MPAPPTKVTKAVASGAWGRAGPWGEAVLLERLPILQNCVAGAEALVEHNRKDRVVFLSPMLYFNWLQQSQPTLVFGSADGALLVCDAVTGQPVRDVSGHRGRVYAVRHSPDGRLLFTASADGTARLWDADTFTELHVLRGHRDGVWPVELAPSGRVAATGDSTGNLRLWDTATGECLSTLITQGSRIWAASFNPKGPGVATGEAFHLITEL